MPFMKKNLLLTNSDCNKPPKQSKNFSSCTHTTRNTQNLDIFTTFHGKDDNNKHDHLFQSQLTMDSSSDEEYDASDALFQRGSYLRRLRELEREDEAQREAERKAEEAANNGQPDYILDYKHYLSNQAYYDDYKHVNYRFVDFGVVGNDRFMIEQDRTVGKGGFVWDAGFILAQYVVGNAREWSATKNGTDMTSILELGAGTGITGLMVSKSVPLTHVHLTDLPELLPLLKKNSENVPNSSAGILEWGCPPTDKKYNVVLGADVVASIYDCTGLAETIYNATTRESKVYLACRDRLAGTVEKLEDYLKSMFERVERRRPQSDNKNPDVTILFATQRRSNQ